MPEDIQLRTSTKITTEEVWKRAQCDDNSATVFVIGDSIDTAEGCIFAVKGGPQARLVRGLLVMHELLPPNGKVIIKRGRK